MFDKGSIFYDILLFQHGKTHKFQRLLLKKAQKFGEAAIIVLTL
jgi:hypothetical protein